MHTPIIVLWNMKREMYFIKLKLKKLKKAITINNENSKKLCSLKKVVFKNMSLPRK